MEEYIDFSTAFVDTGGLGAGARSPRMHEPFYDDAVKIFVLRGMCVDNVDEDFPVSVSGLIAQGKKLWKSSEDLKHFPCRNSADISLIIRAPADYGLKAVYPYYISKENRKRREGYAAKAQPVPKENIKEFPAAALAAVYSKRRCVYGAAFMLHDDRLQKDLMLFPTTFNDGRRLKEVCFPDAPSKI